MKEWKNKNSQIPTKDVQASSTTKEQLNITIPFLVNVQIQIIWFYQKERDRQKRKEKRRRDGGRWEEKGTKEEGRKERKWW